MKRSFLILLSSIVFFGACMKDKVSESYTFYRPVYKTREDVKNSIKSSAPVDIVQTGKIVLRDHYLFLNEIDRGIHVVDIANPSNPVNLAFIAIPGCVDLAVNGNYLYADCYTNLVTIDITNPANVSLLQFQDFVFPRRYYNGFKNDTTKVIDRWERVDTTITERFNGTFANNNGQWGVMFAYMSFSTFSSATSQSSASAGGVAIAGSLARFALQNNRMYTVSDDDLKVFNVTAPAAPSFVSKVNLTEGNIETVFPYKNKLFIGGQTGMYIYDATNPDAPTKFGKFTHARSCDPVIADDKYAYVTLSGGSRCLGYENQLDIVDVSNLANPQPVKTYYLNSPKGLSKDGNTLLICDGTAGLKIFDASNVNTISLVKTVSGFDATDVIAFGGFAIAVAKDGLYIVDYSKPANASVAGKILVASKK